MKKIEPTRELIMGMPLDKWIYESFIATVGTGENWATIYSIHSEDKNKGHASTLIIEMKRYYENKNMVFGSSVSLSPEMSHIIKKLNIPEYK